MSETKSSTPRLLTVSEWLQTHTWPPTEKSLRQLIFYENTNGFASAFKRVGRRVLIDEAEFFKCVDNQK